MNPRVKKSSFLLGFGALAALAGGAILGWALWPAPATAVASPPVSEGPRKPAPLTTKQEKTTVSLPYDLAALKSASAGQLAQFEAWLAIASLDEVMRLLVGQKPDVGFGAGGPVSELILHRFGEFSAAERLAALQQLPPTAFAGYDYHVKKAAVALAKELLPAQAAEVATLLQAFKYLGDY